MAFRVGIGSGVYRDYSGNIFESESVHRWPINSEKIGDFVCPQISLLFEEQFSVLGVHGRPAVLHI